ncbi:hypothetical protein SK128_000407, partial [Halocaridina rubra]
ISEYREVTECINPTAYNFMHFLLGKTQRDSLSWLSGYSDILRKKTLLKYILALPWDETMGIKQLRLSGLTAKDPCPLTLWMTQAVRRGG